MKTKTLLIVFLFNLIAFSIVSQEIWRTTLTAKHPADNFIDANGNIYGVGIKDYGVDESSLADVFLFKMDGDGNELWTASIDGEASNQDQGVAIVVDSDGNVYVTGTVKNVPENTSNRDVMLAKFSSDGTQLWRVDYNGTEGYFDDAVDVLLDDNGNVFLGAITRELYNETDQSADITLFKFDSDGNELWKRHYNGFESDDKLIAMKLVNSEIVLAGNSVYNDNGHYAPIILRYDLDGNLNSESNLSELFPTGFYELQVQAADIDNAGNVYFYTNYETMFSHENDIISIFNANNELVAMDTVRLPEGAADDWVIGQKHIIKADANGDVIIGSSMTTGAGWGRAFNYLSKFTSSGSWTFIDTLSTNGDHLIMLNIIVDDANNILITNDMGIWDDVTYEYDYNMLIRKYNANGEALSEYMLPGFANNSGGNGRDQSSFLLDANGNGILTISTGDHEMTTIKLDISQFGGIGSHVESFIELNEISLYPNPTRSNINISTDKGNIKNVEIYNELGMLVYSNGFNTKMASISVSDFSKGVYLVKVQSYNDIYITRKVLITD